MPSPTPRRDAALERLSHPRRPSLLRSALAASAALLLVALLAPLTPAAADTGARDDFGRTTSEGWGRAQSGGSWTVRGGDRHAVGQAGALVDGLRPGRAFTAQLRGATPTDTRVTAEVTVPGSGFYYAVEARAGDDGTRYRGRLRVDGASRLHSELVRVDPGGREVMLSQRALGTEVRAGEQLRLELAVTGQDAVSLSSRVGRVGADAPDWQTRYTDRSADRLPDPGPVGLWSYLSSSAEDPAGVLTHRFAASGSPQEVPTEEPDRPAEPTDATDDTGSLPIGEAEYAVPENAVFVSPDGSDGASGSRSAPLRTVTAAIDRARDGQTVVLRAGTYHESILVPPQRVLTIQAYPGEAVWFDGAEGVTGFGASGGDWVKEGWDTHFDSSPTYDQGAPDGDEPGWQWIDPDHPMAAHPDQVWVDGEEQQQVGSRADVRPGTFYVDQEAERLWLGTDPDGRRVEASTLSTAISLRAPGTTIRGFGVRRYASSVPQQGVITSYFPSMTLENIVVEDSANAGVGIYGAHCVLDGVTIRGSGQMGLQAHKADDLTVRDLLLEDSNDQQFNPTPAAGGFKVTTSRGVRLTDSRITGTRGSAFWTDHSVHDITVAGNTIVDNDRYGVVLEISSTAVVADNVITDNAFDGVVIINTDKVKVWNNSIAGNRNAVAVVLDDRRNALGNAPGADPRRPRPDPQMPWISRDITLGNNVLSAGTGEDVTAILSTHSYARDTQGNEMVTSSRGNVFGLVDDNAHPVTRWAREGAGPVEHTSLQQHQDATGRDSDSVEVDGTGLNSSGNPSAEVRELVDTVARPMPAEVADAADLPAGSRWLGARR